MSRFGIAIRDTQATPIYRGNLGPWAESVRLSTMLPGGCGTLTFRLRVPPTGILRVPSFFGVGFDIRVADAGEIFWNGRMEDIELIQTSAGRWWEVTAYGYGATLDDQRYTTTDVSGKATNTVVTDALTALAPQITNTTVTATGFTLSAAAATNLTLYTAAAVVSWALRFGDSSFNPQLFTVYPDADGTVRATLEPRPTTPDVEGYIQDFDEVRFGLKGRQLANKSLISYSNNTLTATANDTALQGNGPIGWGFTRTIAAVIPEITQAADANQAASAILTAAKTARMSAASPLTVKPGAFFVDGNGARIKPWRIRSGSLFRFRDVIQYETAGTNISFADNFLIAGTDWDEDSEQLTITPESYEVMLERSAALVRQILAGRLKP